MAENGAWGRLSAIVKSGRRPLGTFITSLDPANTTIMGSAGFDFLMLDGEHGPIDRRAALDHIRAAQAVDAVVLVRVLENSRSLIQSFLDVGAQGVVVPHIHDADAARRALTATRYCAGGRGMCPICYATKYSMDRWQEFVDHSNENNLMIPMIESVAGVRNVAEIAAVEGVEIVLFGPGDLAQDMGLDMFNALPRINEVWLEVREAVHAAGKLVMVPDGFGLDGADIGFKDMDLVILRRAAEAIVAEYRASEYSQTAR